MECSIRAAAAFRLVLVAAGAIALGACAAAPPPPIADLTGTDWRVVMVNGRETPALGDYTMRFGEGGAFGTRLGCNLMGGEYRIAGSMLTVTNLASTLMGCPEPAASFENQGAAVLGRPMQIAFSSNERMYLSNQAGSIALDPAT